MANAIDTLVRSLAVKKIGGKYNLPQFKDEKELLLARKATCEALVELSDTNDVPMSFLVYFALSKEAHRPCNFDKVWMKFNKDKAEMVIKMAKEFAAHNGMRKPNDKVYHACTAYYERFGQDFDTFKALVDAMEAKTKFATVKDILTCLGAKVDTVPTEEVAVATVEA